jgi:carbamoyl-phosphate synthase large subunit
LSLRVFVPSGAGSPGFGGIAECLREDHSLALFAGDINSDAYGKNLVDGFAVMPPAGDPDYLNSVLEKAGSFHCNVLLPVTTLELYKLAEHQELLKSAGLQMAISPYDALFVANHKARLYRFLQTHNLPCVDFRSAKTKNELLAAMTVLGFPKNKVLMKPAEGNGSRGIRIVASLEEVQSQYFNTKAGSLVTSPDALEAELPDNFPLEMLLCEYLPGDEYSVDLLVNRGETLACAIRLRSKIVSGISVKGRFVEDKEMEETTAALVKKLELHGPVGIQYKRNAEGRPIILEINPRLQGAVSTARYVGLNFPLMAAKLALGEIPKPTKPELHQKISFSRYWKDIQD